MATENAKHFWKNQTTYPFEFTRKRRLHELNYLVPRISNSSAKSLLDIGCGDGALLECLLRTTDLQELYGFDLAPDLLTHIDPQIETCVYDIARPGPLPKTDATVIAGAIQYVFDDDIVSAFLSEVNSPIVWIRSTCTLEHARQEVNRTDYASCYRTLCETHELIARHFTINSVDRVYPDSIESTFGTKQFYFEGVTRD